ncbi:MULTISPECIES: AmmeMemoRadiSam system protein A [unclassified Halanaerobium]|uniref:AmmeMemoRadiSam system protein A n=1 Tax=unclassified Halanaerobium TaxID=2641197 RepID=UPI000DF3B72D|nr:MULTISPECIES: AmmeMemoRadiSam system protein A [unclassified Halanaerobium]RCW49280.1 hypothetical protein DFR78_10686 [Halanaerobium sp. MA284_MarDTE_T2]RCW84019.1 hypothetical protein DER71_11544 [Halanaerobium sp. DL-01]
MSSDTKFITDLARKSVEAYVKSGIQIDVPDDLPEILQQRCGAFVTLKKNNKLRGCIGTIKAVQKNAAEEIICNAISAAEKDPRFSPVQKDELDELEISVDLLSEPEKVKSLDELDPKKYGIIVQGNHQTGLLLPDLDGIDTVEKQIAVARKKAGLSESEDITIYRFSVRRFEENG